MYKNPGVFAAIALVAILSILEMAFVVGILKKIHYLEINALCQEQMVQSLYADVNDHMYDPGVNYCEKRDELRGDEE